jgi:hypothetical protein
VKHQIAPETSLELGKVFGNSAEFWTNSVEELERRVCDFFGISSIEEPPKLAINFRCAQERDLETIRKSQNSWEL